MELCKAGFHACEYPLDCLKYYDPANSIYCEVEQSGKILKSAEDSKVASTEIKIGAKLNIAGLVDAAISFVKERSAPNKKHHSTGDRSANSATDYGSANVSTGVNCQNEGAAGCISVGWGKNNRCRGKIGSYLVLSEWGEWDGARYPLLSAGMFFVDGEKIKEDTWYALKNGKVVAVE